VTRAGRAGTGGSRLVSRRRLGDAGQQDPGGARAGRAGPGGRPALPRRPGSDGTLERPGTGERVRAALLRAHLDDAHGRGSFHLAGSGRARARADRARISGGRGAAAGLPGFGSCRPGGVSGCQGLYLCGSRAGAVAVAHQYAAQHLPALCDLLVVHRRVAAPACGARLLG
jgi:hypothetical protein